MKRQNVHRRRFLELAGLAQGLYFLPAVGCSAKRTIDPNTIRPIQPVGAGRMTGVDLRRFYAP
jgi:hypothetical protein